ncbi:hypothetical protein KDE13_07515 [Campylobacter sp. faydin G-140]|uniref:hypothetical protein n=1 Tax=Campylobacter anatolicus TaxID=2829105 RepID=UPI001B8E0BDA|nr:hypothetical protein [Campylobacter anatolicus]MBR8466185.1 hypothetical protein [Campylobacter anatolicus]
MDLSRHQAFKAILGYILALSDTNTAIAFDKTAKKSDRLRAIYRVALIDEILTYILNCKKNEND